MCKAAAAAGGALSVCRLCWYLLLLVSTAAGGTDRCAWLRTAERGPIWRWDRTHMNFFRSKQAASLRNTQGTARSAKLCAAADADRRQLRSPPAPHGARLLAMRMEQLKDLSVGEFLVAWARYVRAAAGSCAHETPASRAAADAGTPPLAAQDAASLREKLGSSRAALVAFAEGAAHQVGARCARQCHSHRLALRASHRPCLWAPAAGGCCAGPAAPGHAGRRG